MSFGEFLKQRIFGPLDMPDTDFQVTPDNKDRLTQIYQPKGIKPGSFFAAATSAKESK